jgi:hypothetical protein
MQLASGLDQAVLGIARRRSDVDLGAGREMGPTGVGDRGAPRRDFDRKAPEQGRKVVRSGHLELGRHVVDPGAQ